MNKPLEKYCMCDRQRRSDCRRGDRCRALIKDLAVSEEPQWVAARIVFACGLTCGGVLLAHAAVKFFGRANW